MLARIAQELFWLGRNLARAEQTSRLLDGVFQADLQGRPEDPGAGRLSWDSLMHIMGGRREREVSDDRDAVLDALTHDPDNPASVVACVARAREGASAVRDVISAEMWEAINTTHLRLRDGEVATRLHAGPYGIYQHVKERSALFWGLTARTMLRDEASAFLNAGGRIEAGDMVLRMLRVALPIVPHGNQADGQAIALLQGSRRLPGLPSRRSGSRARRPGRALPDVRAQLSRLGRGGRRRRQTPRCGPRTRTRAARSRSYASAGSAPTSSSGAAPRATPTCVSPARRSSASSGSWTPTSPSATSAAQERPSPHRAAMHFSIRFRTEYVYGAPVTDNLNALRVRPATTSGQRCDEFTVRIEPEARIGRHSDYFGTEVLEFGIVRPHTRLAIDVRARVVTAEPPEPPDAPWPALGTEAYAEAAGEYLLAALDEPPGDVLDELCATARAQTPLATLRGLCDLIADRYEYRPGATYVGSTVDEFLQAGAGVCQDYVHLALILLRRNGIAARYVSGYLWAAPADEGDDSVEVETHAWLEALLPSENGRGEPVWVGADPTNRRLAGERHVKIGHGRNYGDVPPVRGVYQGGATSKLDASVHMTRLDPQASARA